MKLSKFTAGDAYFITGWVLITYGHLSSGIGLIVWAVLDLVICAIKNENE